MYWAPNPGNGEHYPGRLPNVKIAQIESGNCMPEVAGVKSSPSKNTGVASVVAANRAVNAEARVRFPATPHLIR